MRVPGLSYTGGALFLGGALALVLERFGTKQAYMLSTPNIFKQQTVLKKTVMANQLLLEGKVSFYKV